MGQINSTLLQEAITTYKTVICQQSDETKSLGRWIPNPNVDEARRLIGKSFAGTETVVGEPFGTWSRSHFGDWYTLDQHASLVSFGLGIPVRVAFQNHALILAKSASTKGADDARDGEMAAVAVVTEVDKSQSKTWIGTVYESWQFFVALLKNIYVDGFSDMRKTFLHRHDYSMFGEKISAAMDSMQPHHPTQIHWYVMVIGTHPEHQGKGYGTALMNLIAMLADRAGRTVFLECGESNRAFYDKMGYQLVATEIVKDPVNSEGKPLTTYAMMRSPKSLIQK